MGCWLNNNQSPELPHYESLDNDMPNCPYVTWDFSNTWEQFELYDLADAFN